MLENLMETLIPKLHNLFTFSVAPPFVCDTTAHPSPANTFNSCMFFNTRSKSTFHPAAAIEEAWKKRAELINCTKLITRLFSSLLFESYRWSCTCLHYQYAN